VRGVTCGDLPDWPAGVSLLKGCSEAHYGIKNQVTVWIDCPVHMAGFRTDSSSYHKVVAKHT
jgi:hypothetical protein